MAPVGLWTSLAGGVGSGGWPCHHHQPSAITTLTSLTPTPKTMACARTVTVNVFSGGCGGGGRVMCGLFNNEKVLVSQGQWQVVVLVVVFVVLGREVVVVVFVFVVVGGVVVLVVVIVVLGRGGRCRSGWCGGGGGRCRCSGWCGGDGGRPLHSPSILSPLLPATVPAPPLS